MAKHDVKDFENRFITGDCGEVLKDIPAQSVDLILTSPPYADRRDYGSKGAALIAPDEYIEWFAPKAKEFYRVLKDDGSFVLNISDKVVENFQHLYVFKLVIYLCEEVGFHYVRDYIWHNTATPPNVFSRGGLGRTKKSHEYCFWFAKGETWTFNMDAIRRPYSKDMKKFLDGKGKGDRAQNQRPSTHNFNCEKVWADNGGADPGTVIEVGNTNSNDAFAKLCRERGIGHPARFPEKLAEFFILSGTNEGALVIDPFSGSGTTAVVAAKTGRRFIGIDSNADYNELASERIAMETEGGDGYAGQA